MDATRTLGLYPIHLQSNPVGWGEGKRYREREREGERKRLGCIQVIYKVTLESNQERHTQRERACLHRLTTL